MIPQQLVTNQVEVDMEEVILMVEDVVDLAMVMAEDVDEDVAEVDEVLITLLLAMPHSIHATVQLHK